MANKPIRIAVLAQAAKAKQELQRFAAFAKQNVQQVSGSLSAGGLAAGVGLAGGISAGLAQADVTAKLGAQLGASKQEAARLGKVAGSLYSENFGDSLDQVGQAVANVQRNIGNLGTADLKATSSGVLTLTKVFDQDLTASTRAVGQLLRTGLAKDAKGALDILTVGFQQGGDKAGDLLDTFNEYGTQFRKLGLDGGQAMGLITQGLQAGARDADTVADAIKEFSIRAIDGSKVTSKGFQAVGLDAAKMAKDIAAGGPRANAALDETLDRLRGIQDPVKRSQAAVALFGTKAEDLGDALFKLDLSTASAGMKNLEGATKRASDAVANTPTAKIEQLKRSLTEGLTNILGNIAGFAIANQTWLVPLVGTIAGIAAAVWSVNAAVTAWAAVTKAYTGVQWLLNAALTANPIGLIVIGIAALVAGLVIAYKKSETFRRIVDGAFKGVLRAAQGAWQWVKANWPLLLAIITGPIGLAVRLVVKNFDAIVAKVKSIPGRIKDAFSGAKGLLTGAGRAVIDGFTGAIQAKFKDVKEMLGRLTNLLPDWKGPASKDKRILTGPADLIMDGFLKRLESRYSDVRSSLGSFTDSLSGVGSTGRTAPLSAVPLLNSSSGSSSSSGTQAIRLVADGGSRDLGRLFVELLGEVTRKGGGLKAMGVTL